MLISFTLENFKSFYDRAALSLMAHRSEKSLQSALLTSLKGMGEKDALLPATAIYGANASGKSNFLLGLLYMRRVVIDSQTDWKADTGTRLDPNIGFTDTPSFFEITFLEKNVKYRYGFKLDRHCITKEWLYSYPVGRERLLFERDGTINGDEYTNELRTGNSFSGDKREHDSSFRRTKTNSLFVSSAAQDNQEECKIVEQWFRKNVVASTRLDANDLSQGQTTALAYKYKRFKSLLLPLLKSADPCIENIEITAPEDEVDLDELDYETWSTEIRKYKVAFVVNSKNGLKTIPFQNQSRGVKRLYAMSAALISALNFGKLMVIDEFETSMHPHVASQILSLFQNKSSNPRGAQLLFATHETRLLNLHHLRRDQIWFVEKNEEGCSEIFSLLEFSPRKDENFEIGYLRGRYGAMPKAAVSLSWLEAINGQRFDLQSE